VCERRDEELDGGNANGPGSPTDMSNKHAGTQNAPSKAEEARNSRDKPEIERLKRADLWRKGQR